MIPALVLTAGLATRLRPLSFVRAKGALPLGKRCIAERILAQLAAVGVTDAVLNLHHLPETLTRRIGDGTGLGLRVRYSWETPVLGSAGGPRRAIPLLGAPRFLVVNGDTLTDVDIAAVVAEHERQVEHGALATLAVVPNREPAKYSGLAVDAHGAVTGLVRRGSSQPSAHFIGVQVLEASAFADVSPDVPSESIAELYPRLIAERPGSIRVYRCGAEFMDIGTPADYLETALLLAAREDGPLVGARGDVAATARIERSVLWDDVVVGDGALLRDCIVTDGAHVPGDTSWHGVTLRAARDGDLAKGEKRIGDLAVAAL